MKILNLFAGIGGNRQLWEADVTAIEKDQVLAWIYQQRFPNDQVLVMDVFDYLRDKTIDLDQYEFIWASPPCQSHSQMMKFDKNFKKRVPIPNLTEIYGLIIWLEKHYNGLYAIENVIPYYSPLIKHIVDLDRHLIWANFPIRRKRFRNRVGKYGSLSCSRLLRDSIEEIAESKGIDPTWLELLENDRKRMTIIRNCVDPRIGKHVLDESMRKELTILDYVS